MMNLTVKELKQLFPQNSLQGADETQIQGINRDSRGVQPGEVYVAIRGERLDGHQFVAEAFKKGALAVVVDRPVSAQENVIEVEDVSQAMGKLASYYRKKFAQPLIAITGSNGKTTTKELLCHVLSSQHQVVATEGNLNNHIGVPVTLFRFSKEAGFFIVEMGMNHFEEIRYLAKMAQPDMAVISSIGRAHLEGVGETIEGVAKAKGELFEELSEQATAFVFADDPLIKNMKTKAHRVSYGFAEGSDYQVDDVSLEAGGTRFKIKFQDTAVEVRWSLVGRHHVQNAVAVFAIAHTLGLSLDAIVQAFSTFTIKMNRGRILKIAGMTVMDDSYNANPESIKLSLAALCESFPQAYKVAVLGDMLELGDQSVVYHREVGRYCQEVGIDHLLAYGEFAKDYVQGFAQPERGTVFDSHQEMGDELKEISKALDKDMAILLKGSRPNKMEMVLDYLES